MMCYGVITVTGAVFTALGRCSNDTSQRLYEITCKKDNDQSIVQEAASISCKHLSYVLTFLACGFAGANGRCDETSAFYR